MRAKSDRYLVLTLETHPMLLKDGCAGLFHRVDAEIQRVKSGTLVEMAYIPGVETIESG